MSSTVCAFGLQELLIMFGVGVALGGFAVGLWFHATGIRGPEA